MLVLGSAIPHFHLPSQVECPTIAQHASTHPPGHRLDRRMKVAHRYRDYRTMLAKAFHVRSKHPGLWKGAIDAESRYSLHMDR
ncbi:unnamed protein product [Peniophora sp. CBMAI 1063]|nr:unnamed protein product [Peniophora sp. CBMAI 1063]